MLRKGACLISIIYLILGLLAGAAFLYYARYQAEDERQALSVGLMIVGMIYVAFALLWGDGDWFVIELTGLLMCALFYRLSCWHSVYWLAAGWLLHPLWDVLLHINGPGHVVAPHWYAVACISFDVLVGVYVLMRVSYFQSQSSSNIDATPR